MSSASAPEPAPVRSSGISPRFGVERAVLAIAAVNLVFHLATSTRYGYFGDELYYYGCSEHLQWGYIDHPPLVAGLMWIATHLFGTSLLGIRAIPALLSAVLVWLAAATARELKGGPFAQALAACAVVVTPVYMSVFHFFSMNAVEPVLWTASILAVLRAIGGNPRYWMLFGALCGLGFENKYSIAFFLSGVVLGLILSPHRSLFLQVHFWIGALLALLIFLPNLLWQSHHGFPFLQWRSVMEQRGEIPRVPVGTFVEHQLLLTGATCIVWTAGLGYLLAARRARPYRFIAITYFTVIVLLIVLKGKTPYATPIYASLFAAGAVWLEGASAKQPWLRPATISVLVVSGVILAPCFVPILPIDRVVAYQSKIPLPLPIQTERYATHQKLPQNFSLESGWEEMVAEIAQVYHGLPPERQANAAILSFHYAPAGAVDLLGPKYGLPKAISTAMSWHDFGPRQYHGDTIILVGYMFPPSFCQRFEEAPPLENRFVYDGVGLKGNLIHVCYGLRFDLQQHWEGLPWF